MRNDTELLGKVFQALADPTRRAVIQRLSIGPASTTELARPFNMALPSFMQQLITLERSSLITSHKAGRVRTWQIDQEQLVVVESWLNEQRMLWEGRTDRLVEYVEEWYQRETSMTDDRNDIIVSRFIKAPRRIVWKAWTVPKHLEQWWCPKPMTTTVVGFDLRPGGAFDILMGEPSGATSPITGAFLEIMPEERIVFTTALTHGWRPATTSLPITAIISLTSEGDGTRYVTQVLIKNEEERQKLQEIDFETGWSIGIDQLEELVAQLV
jgi:uncharacterized protein YndB with AHSA1/START domain